MIRVPGPALVRAVAAAASTMPDVIVRAPPETLLYCWTIRSVPLPEVIVPPAIVEALAPTAGVTRTPPVATVSAPLVDAVVAAEVLNRSDPTAEVVNVPLVLASKSVVAVVAV